MQYLTVQDIIWINALAMKSPQRFDFSRLEEASYYQYAYGGSNDLAGQASRLLSGFRQQAPFEAGNDVTAFVAFVALLKANGKGLKEGAARKVLADPTPQAVADAIEDGHFAGHAAETRECIAEVFAEYSETIANLKG